MIQISINWKVNVSITTILLIVGVVLFFIYPQAVCGGGRKPSYGIPAKILEELGYKLAEHATSPKPLDLPPAVKESVTSTVFSSGYWISQETYTPDDTVAVDLSEVTLGDGTHWVKVLIDSTEVKWHRLEYYSKPAEPGRWAGGLEAAVLHNFNIGVYVGYRLFNISDVKIEVAGVVDIRQDIAQSPQWIAGEVRASKSFWKSVEVGGGLGALLSEEGVSPHASIGIGVRF